MKNNMAKKTTPRRTRASNKTPKIKNTAGSGTHNKSSRLKRDSIPQVPLPETLSEDSTEEKNHGAVEVVQPKAVEQETSDKKTTRATAVEPPMTAAPDSDTKPRGATDARGVEKGPADTAPEAEDVLELLAVRLADEEYAADILLIKEIIRMMEITPVPRRPAYIKGVVSLRGTIIPVFDLRTRLGLTESPPGRSTRILVVGLDKGLVGVIADSVTDVVKVKMSHVEPPPAVRGGSSSGHLKGVTRINERLLILLDLEKTIRSE